MGKAAGSFGAVLAQVVLIFKGFLSAVPLFSLRAQYKSAENVLVRLDVARDLQILVAITGLKGRIRMRPTSTAPVSLTAHGPNLFWPDTS